MSSSPNLQRLGRCMAALALCASFEAAADIGSYCSTGAFSQLTTVGLCGQIQGSGAAGPDNATFTVNGAPLQAGLAPVALSGTVTGTGLFGSVSASGTYGKGHVYASAQDTNPRSLYSSMFTQGNFSFIDGFTIGASDVESKVTLSVDGTLAGTGTADLYFNMFDVTPYQSGYVLQGLDLRPVTVQGVNLGYKSYDLVFKAGHSYSFDFSMVAEADAREDFLYNNPQGIADLSNTGNLNFDVVTPGAALGFLSGHDYSTAAVDSPSDPLVPGPAGGSAIPEPPAVALVFIGLAGLGFVGRRRSRRSTIGSPNE